MNIIHPKIKNMSPLFIVAYLERSLNFYTQNLGFEIDFRYEDFYAGIISNGYSIHLKLGIPVREERTNKRDNEHIDITFSVEDIEILFDAIKGLPVSIVQPLRQMPYGREFYINDPDGYILAFLE